MLCTSYPAWFRIPVRVNDSIYTDRLPTFKAKCLFLLKERQNGRTWRFNHLARCWENSRAGGAARKFATSAPSASVSQFHCSPFIYWDVSCWHSKDPWTFCLKSSLPFSYFERSDHPKTAQSNSKALEQRMIKKCSWRCLFRIQEKWQHWNTNKRVVDVTRNSFPCSSLNQNQIQFQRSESHT